MKRLSILFLLFTFLISLEAQFISTPSGSEIQHEMQKLSQTARVLYIAAHPDDENTRLISHLANGMKLETAYLSLTRGDGGQNLIGTELGDDLGVIRTEELRAARRLDGGIQFFTRAKDFGYSKTSEETLEKWDRNIILEDMVRVIRTFKPDVIITRFPPKKYNYPTHGHHETSAILAEEAFEMAADKTKFSHQIAQLGVWQAKRLYWNTSTWFYRRTGKELNPEDKIIINIGEYLPLLGKSCNEIAALSRSQHKSQGFGAAGARGEQLEYLEYVKGSQSSSLLEGVCNDFKCLGVDEALHQSLNEIVQNFNPEKPGASVSSIVRAMKLLDKSIKLTRDKSVKSRLLTKQVLLKQILASCLGLYFEVSGDKYFANPGGALKVTAEFSQRINYPTELNSLKIGRKTIQITSKDAARALKDVVELESEIKLPRNMAYSGPFWLVKNGKNPNIHHPVRKSDGVKPYDSENVQVALNMTIDGYKIDFQSHITYKWTDRVKGELHRDLEILPQATVNLNSEVAILTEGSSKMVSFFVKAWDDNVNATLVLPRVPGFAYKTNHRVSLKNAGDEKEVMVKVTALKQGKIAHVKPYLVVNGKRITKGYKNIMYDHIPVRSRLYDIGLKLVNLGEFKPSGEIGYIMGAGDKTADGLIELGYRVTQLTEVDLTEGELEKFKAVVVGIRALNTHEWMENKAKVLGRYVENGGNLIFQYNTTWGLKTSKFGPVELKVGRGRVTKEDAEMIPEKVGIPVLMSPYQLEMDDYKNWVQERGLYFLDSWPESMDNIFVMGDTPDEKLKGALVTGKVGQGNITYVGISFFRQIPAGVPGAYKLLVNLIEAK